MAEFFLAEPKLVNFWIQILKFIVMIKNLTWMIESRTYTK